MELAVATVILALDGPGLIEHLKVTSAIFKLSGTISIAYSKKNVD